MSPPAAGALFSQRALEQHLQQATDIIPPGRKGALIAMATLSGEIRIGVAQRVGNHISVAVSFDVSRAGVVAGGIVGKASW